MLLGTVLGLRACDVVALKLMDIDWLRGEIHIVQSKTSNPVILPLTQDVGEAVKDYILNVRPSTADKEIFLRINAPHKRLAAAVTVGEIYRGCCTARKRETYLRHFIKFDKWCVEEHPDQTQLSRELVLDWINDIASSSYNTAQRVASMRQFARYLCAIGEEAYVLPEQYAPLKKPDCTAGVDYMSMAAITAIIEKPGANTPKGLRDRFFMILLYDTGARIQEILDIKLCDVHLAAFQK